MEQVLGPAGSSTAPLDSPFVVDVAVIGGTNFAALRPPLTEAERKQAIKNFTANTVIPKKPRKTKAKKSKEVASAQDVATAAPPKRGRPRKVAPAVTADTTASQSIVQRRNMPRRRGKFEQSYAESSADEGPSDSEADPDSGLRQTKRPRRG